MVGNLDASYVAISCQFLAKNNKQTNKQKNKQTNKQRLPAVTASLLSQSKDTDSSTLCQVCVQLLQNIRAKQRETFNFKTTTTFYRQPSKKSNVSGFVQGSTVRIL